MKELLPDVKYPPPVKIYDLLEKQANLLGKLNFSHPVVTPHGRLKSWETCYLFFKQNCSVLSSASHPQYLSTLNQAQLHLGFYLASFGMYRNQALLNCDSSVFKYLIINLFSVPREHFYEHNYLCSLKEIQQLSNAVKTSLQKSLEEDEIYTNCSNTLITKILMGIFGCVPAYDTYFSKSIRKLACEGKAKNIQVFSSLTGQWNDKGYIALLNLANDPEVRRFIEAHRPHFYNDKNIEYPLMRCIDLILWFDGFTQNK